MKHPLLTRKIYDLLLRRLAARTWRPGSRCPPLRQLAQDLSTSLKPVRGAFLMAAGERLLSIRPRQRARVLPGADRRAVRLLAESHLATRRQAIAILIPDEYSPIRGDPFHGRLVRAVTAAAADRGWDCRLAWIPSDDHFRLARKVLRQFDAGLVIEPSPQKLGVLYQLAAHGFPMLSYARQIPGIDHPVLTTDDYGASGQLGRLMAERGHRNLCFLESPKHEYLNGARPATQGWMDFLNQTGLIDTCTMPLVYHKGDTFALLLERLLRMSPAITGLVLSVPTMLEHIGGDERFRDVRIPGDVSLAAMSSVTGIAWPSRHPPITSFEVDWDRAGRCAVEMIEQMLAGNPRPKSIRVPLNIRLTESIGPAPGSAAAER